MIDYNFIVGRRHAFAGHLRNRELSFFAETFPNTSVLTAQSLQLPGGGMPRPTAAFLNYNFPKEVPHGPNQ